MKRVGNQLKKEPLLSSGNIPDDIWSYIFNIYYLLKYNEQWTLFKEAARSCSRFIMPVDKIEIPLYTGFQLPMPDGISLCYKILRLYWNQYGIGGIKVDTFQFQPNNPLVPINTKPLTLVNHVSIKTMGDLHFGGTMTPIKNIIPTGPSIGTLVISLGALPHYIFQ